MVAYTGLRVITHLGPGQVISVDYHTGMCLVRLEHDEMEIWFLATALQPCVGISR